MRGNFQQNPPISWGLNMKPKHFTQILACWDHKVMNIMPKQSKIANMTFFFMFRICVLVTKSQPEVGDKKTVILQWQLCCFHLLQSPKFQMISLASLQLCLCCHQPLHVLHIHLNARGYKTTKQLVSLFILSSCLITFTAPCHPTASTQNWHMPYYKTDCSPFRNMSSKWPFYHVMKAQLKVQHENSQTAY